MENILGAGNTIWNYLLVILIYFFMFLFIRYPKPGIELNFRRNYNFLIIVWAIAMFTGNYIFYRLGLMSFLPWLNNIIHSFLWVGICLARLYYSCRERPMIEQILFFCFTSFIIKMAENLILGTWNFDSYLGIDNPYAYIIVMSLVDGVYPVLSSLVLKAFGRRGVFGLYIPQ